MKNTPINYDIVKSVIDQSGIVDIGKSTIREIVRLIDIIEKETGEKYIRMEMGVPGLKPSSIAINAEKEALDRNCAASYPPLDGIPELKKETSKFIKNFIDINVSPRSCIPTSGSIMGGYATFMVAGRRDPKKDTVLFIDPGFPVHKQLVKMVGLKSESFDVYNYRSEKLKDKLESYLEKGNISTILYSNPNNPSWVCFTDEELKIIGDLANKYDVIVAEDLAYFAMDFRKDLSKLGEAPFQPSVAKYTDNYMIMISTSKSFSYAGQRIGLLAISDKLFERDFEGLSQYYNTINYGYCVVQGTVYSTTAGCSHSAQYGIAALLKAINNNEFDFIDDIKEYGRRAVIMKDLFVSNGFKIVYDTDIDEPIADGFYFTISYPGFTGEELIGEFIYYGISAMALRPTGSEKTEGLRACVSQVNPTQFGDLEKRLIQFHNDHKTK